MIKLPCALCEFQQGCLPTHDRKGFAVIVNCTNSRRLEKYIRENRKEDASICAEL